MYCKFETMFFAQLARIRVTLSLIVGGQAICHQAQTSMYRQTYCGELAPHYCNHLDCQMCPNCCLNSKAATEIFWQARLLQWWPHLRHAATDAPTFYSANSKQNLLFMAALKSKYSAANRVADVSCSMKY